MIVFPFVIQEQLISSSFCKILGWSILIQSFAKFIMGDILADTAILANASKKDSLCSCYKHTSWMGWLLKKRALSVINRNRLAAKILKVMSSNGHRVKKGILSGKKALSSDLRSGSVKGENGFLK